MADDISGAIPGLLGVAIVGGIAARMFDGPRRQQSQPKRVRTVYKTRPARVKVRKAKRRPTSFFG